MATILEGDIKLLASRVMDDVPEGRWRPDRHGESPARATPCTRTSPRPTGPAATCPSGRRMSAC
ncbi:hypothetical protein GO497_09130 [Acidovorax citrulli]|nr:hypothetical protein [Paracidovorax citrulli]